MTQNQGQSQGQSQGQDLYYISFSIEDHWLGCYHLTADNISEANSKVIQVSINLVTTGKIQVYGNQSIDIDVVVYYIDRNCTKSSLHNFLSEVMDRFIPALEIQEICQRHKIDLVLLDKNVSHPINSNFPTLH
jgi:hypothetical protein